METHLTWKSKFFSRTCEISEHDNPAGELTRMAWKRISTGELKGVKVRFDIKGFFDKDFIIKNPEDDSPLGRIIFNIWRTKATITIADREYNWEFDNFFHTKWSISDNNGPLVRYQSSFKRGDITAYTDNMLLILTGLYIKEYLKERAQHAAAAST